MMKASKLQNPHPQQAETLLKTITTFNSRPYEETYSLGRDTDRRLRLLA
jgi:hypothetical protein